MSTKPKKFSSKAASKAVLVYFPNEIMPVIDRAVGQVDLDRSKFIRAAVREKLQRLAQ